MVVQLGHCLYLIQICIEKNRIASLRVRERANEMKDRNSEQDYGNMATADVTAARWVTSIHPKEDLLSALLYILHHELELDERVWFWYRRIHTRLRGY